MPPRLFHRAGVSSPARRQLLQTTACVLAASPWLAFAQSTQSTSASSTDVALAGFAYAGNAATKDQRFPFSVDYERVIKSEGRSAYARIADATKGHEPSGFRLVGQIDSLKGRDQAIAVALVVGAETVSVELLAGIHKLFVLVRAQALFFDFKSMSIVRAYPISFAVIDRFDRPPTREETLARVRSVYEGAEGKPGIFARFAEAVAKATLPSSTSRTLQVARITFKPELMPLIPPPLSSGPGIVETWGADLVGEAISTRTGVPIVPFSKGYAIGNVMSLRVSDGEVFALTLPKADYEITVDVSNLRKIEYGKSAAGTSYIYGAYATIRIEEPVSGKAYLDTALKNGEVKLVPSTQTVVDDFPAYYDALNLMFVKLSEAIAGKQSDWLKTSATATDIDRQLIATRELIKLCK